MREKRFSVRALVLTVVLTVLLTAALLAGILCLLLGKEGMSMAQAMVLINTQFVGEHDIGEAVDGAMDSLITGLGDRWSYYMDAEGYARQKENKSNAYVGLGCTVSYPETEGLLIEAVTEAGPGGQGGLEGRRSNSGDRRRPDGGRGAQPGHRVHAGAGWVRSGAAGPAGGWDRTAFQSGPRQSGGAPVSYERLDDGTGVVTIRNFNSRCAEEAVAAVEELEAQGVERLVFDVRNNGGGYLDELTTLLDYLLPEGTIFRSEDKAGHQSSVQSDAACVDLPMAVLVNGDTYSAAELFAAELQEMEWGIIVGTPTFGKGFSQQTFPLLSRRDQHLNGQILYRKGRFAHRDGPYAGPGAGAYGGAGTEAEESYIGPGGGPAAPSGHSNDCRMRCDPQ